MIIKWSVGLNKLDEIVFFFKQNMKELAELFLSRLTSVGNLQFPITITVSAVERSENQV